MINKTVEFGFEAGDIKTIGVCEDVLDEGDDGAFLGRCGRDNRELGNIHGLEFVESSASCGCLILYYPPEHF